MAPPPIRARVNMLSLYGLIWTFIRTLDEAHFHIMLYLYIEKQHAPRYETQKLRSHREILGASYKHKDNILSEFEED